ncbi:hypothetical protein L1987_46458 [Smallanthus sonchifolius]|uniref:Uncharacterized protein n=1 Tax=Smallanthus sonchifolius TaxID=185202 RepID=A0ACB9FZX5_9ASTR|nr:hypothetical protein L1987_46458 [Smallanthus sonchifolius]
MKIEGHRFPVRLFVMVLGGFDVVLGMNWLTANEAQIICKRKIIRLMAPGGSEVEVFGDREAPMPNVMSMIKATKYLRRGCKAYLVYVIEKCNEVKELDDVPVVREYPEVFPEDLPRIPPDREIEFRIDLVPDAQPMAKAPYRLAPVEMKELIAHLDELLKKGFIKPSISPWGAPVLFVKKKDGSMRMCDVAQTRRWLEILKDYDCEIIYHPGKANVGADALSRKDVPAPIRVKACQLVITSDVMREIEKAQDEALKEENIKKERMVGQQDKLEYNTLGVRTCFGRVLIPMGGELRTQILDEAHKSRYSIHPGTNKMDQDLKKEYWWPGMKHELTKYVSKCLTCSQVKAEHQKPYGKIQPLDILEWKWEHITMDFITKLPRTAKGHDTIWVIVDRLTKSAHFLPIHETFASEMLVEVFINEVVARHGMPLTIVSDRDT